MNDLARAAEVEGIVTRSISGHLTERMQAHYSTVSPDEQRTGIARVIDLMAVRGGREHGDATERSTREEVSESTSALPSGAPGGAPTPSSGAPNKKAS